MSVNQYQFLIALADAGCFDVAARACGVPTDELRAAIRQIEEEFRRDIVAPGTDFCGLTGGTIDSQRPYQLVRQTSPVVDRLFEIEFLDPGAEAFAFTFG